jgi:membrane protein implicated in regulation of membrane protease activity
MTWADFYLVCFLVGLALSFLSFLLGSLHVHFHLSDSVSHLPHIHLDLGGHGGFAHGHVSVTHASGMAHASGVGHAPSGHGGSSQPEISWFNFGTVTTFLAWFGGAGYLLATYTGFFIWTVFALAMAAGLVGGSIMFIFVAKVLMKHDKALNPMDYDMIGVLGTVTVPIREGGTGEIVFSQEGFRRCAGARADAIEAIPKGTEVIVTRYEKGLAYVRRWDELANEATPVTDGTNIRANGAPRSRS